MPQFTGDAVQYNFLFTLGQLPRMVDTAISLYDVAEIPGPQNDKRIMAWRDELKIPPGDYPNDEVPWCGLFMAYVARKAGKTPVAHPLWALNWGKFGSEGGQPLLGDVLTFVRPGGGHVALYIGEDPTHYHVLGGNQSNRVCFTRIPKRRLKAVRRPPYMNRPASAKPYLLKADGVSSSDER